MRGSDRGDLQAMAARQRGDGDRPPSWPSFLGTFFFVL